MYLMNTESLVILIFLTVTLCITLATVLTSEKDNEKGGSRTEASCVRPPLTNAHLGNTLTDVKYAMHCSTPGILNQCVTILEAVGFTVFKRETTGMLHTFMHPPSDFMRNGTFMYVLVVKPGGNNQKLNLDSNVQGVHVGFRTTLDKLEGIRHKVCNLTNTLAVVKPDETSLFIELPCGEVAEVVGRGTPKIDVFQNEGT